MIIDAHLHVWDLERAEYPWMDAGLGDLHRTIGFDEILPTLQREGIQGAILVQASDEAADTEVMRSAAAAHPEILGIVAWSPLDEPARFASEVERFAADPVVVGVRNLVHEHPAAWLDRPEIEESLAALARWNLPLDFPTANPAALAALPGIGARHPDLTIVIDHLGKPPLGGTTAERDEWRRLIAECARNPRTVAKVSGLYSATGPMDGWTTPEVVGYVEDALELFGPSRLLYGGDWPIADLAGGYDRGWRAIRTALEGLSGAERDLVLGGTAQRVYSLA